METQFTLWGSKSLLLGYLSQWQKSIVIGSDAEAPRGYYSCSLGSSDNPIQVAIITNQPNIPALLFLPQDRYVLVGHDQSISILDLKIVSISDSILLEGVFFEFFHDEKQGLVLALHELGCMALSEEGKVLWRYLADDILEDWKIANDQITFTEMDRDEPVVVSLLTGLSV